MAGINAKTLGNFKITQVDFQDPKSALANEVRAENWPVVYLLSGEEKPTSNKASSSSSSEKDKKFRIYIGETSHCINRLKQHKENTDRSYVTSVRVIFDPHYTKSAILDIEQSLIRLFSAEPNYVLDNRNAGQSAAHNYYQRELYQLKLPLIWAKLRELGVVKQSYEEITQSSLYTYSPFTALTEEQNEVCRQTLQRFVEALESGKSSAEVIQGTAGTGKTIVAINLMKIVAEINQMQYDPSPSLFEEDLQFPVNSFLDLKHRLRVIRGKRKKELKLGYVVAMTNLRNTIKDVFQSSKAKDKILKGALVVGPYQIVDESEEYDLLIVDEAHRLTRKKNLLPGAALSYRRNCDLLQLEAEEATALDWCVMRSKFQVLFYDPAQSVRPSDITPEQFDSALKRNDEQAEKLELKVQMRCAAGMDYIEFLTDLLNGQARKKVKFSNFDLFAFDDVDDMVSTIKALENEKNMICRNVAGYAWKWQTKGKSEDEIKAQNLYDIDIDGHQYYWNTKATNWILSKNSINEIGCVHTTQGFDLSYVGVIMGPEIDYVDGEIVVYKDKVMDVNTKKGAEDLKAFIINTYKVLMSRGIHGCFIYACNPNMREYLKSVMSTIDEEARKKMFAKKGVHSKEDSLFS